MNKWSLLLFSVLGLLLSTTSKSNFVDGRLGCGYRSSRPLLSDTRLSIYEPYCTYYTFTEISQLTLPKEDIRYVTKNVALKRSSRSDSRRGQFENRRISSDERFRVLSNVGFDFEDTTLSNSRDKKGLRETNDLQLRKNLKSFSRDTFRENYVDRTLSRNNNYLWNKMEHDSRERVINIEEELLEIKDNRFRRNDKSLNVDLKDRKRERFARRTFVVRTNIMPNARKNIDETRLRLIGNNEGKTDIERSNIDINTRRRLFRDTHFTSDLSTKNNRRYKKDDRSSHERLSDRDNNIDKSCERESLIEIRQHTDMDRKINFQRRSYDEDNFEKILVRNDNRNVVIRDQNERLNRLVKVSSSPRTIHRESRIRDDKRQMINGNENRLFEQRYSTRSLSRQHSNRHQEKRQAGLYIDRNLEDGEGSSHILMERAERVFDQRRNRKIGDNNREVRLSDKYMTEHISLRKQNSFVEKRVVGSNNNNRRSDSLRRTLLEDREREEYRYELENENIWEQRRIRKFRNSHDEDKLRGARNIQRRLIRYDIRQKTIYDDDHVSEGLLGNDDSNRKLDRRLERERLSRTEKRSSLIRTIQRENQHGMHNDENRGINIQDNRLRDDPKNNRRLISLRIAEHRRARTYDEKSGNEDREEFRNSLVRGTERAYDEKRIRQIRDNDEYRHEYRLNVERTVERIITQIDRNRNNVRKAFLRIISSSSNNRLYGTIRRDVSVITRRENSEVRYWAVYENEKIIDQRRTRDVRERREDDLSNERIDRQNLARRNNMNNGMLNNNRRRYYDENNSEEMVKNKNRDMTNRSKREKENSLFNRRSSHLKIIQRENENERMYNDNRQPMNNQESRVRKQRNSNRRSVRRDSDINRIVEDRRAAILGEILNRRHDFRNVLASETEREFDENKTRQLQDSREYMINEKLNAKRVLVRHVNNNLEKRGSRIKHDFDVNHLSKNIKRNLIILQLREKDESSLMRFTDRDQSKNGRELTRLDGVSINNRITESRGLRNINERSNARDTRNKVITGYLETKIDFHDNYKTYRERRTELVIRNIARYGMDRTTHRMRISMRTLINNRDVLEARSEKHRNVNREYIKNVRSFNGLENSAHRENKDNSRTSDRENKREREVKYRARYIRVSNHVQMSKDSRLTQTRTNEDERAIRTAFYNTHLPIEHKIQSDYQIFENKLQYIFYLLQVLYILGLFHKFAKNSHGIHKTTRFSHWFLSSTLKVD